MEDYVEEVLESIDIVYDFAEHDDYLDECSEV